MFTTDLDPSIFPNIPSGIDVHRGFADEHAKWDFVHSPYARQLLIPIAIALLLISQDRSACAPGRK
jgi:hypothetical protein